MFSVYTLKNGSLGVGLHNSALLSRDAHYALSTKLFYFFSTYCSRDAKNKLFRELYFVMKNMDVSNGTLSPNCFARRPDKWVHSYIYIRQLHSASCWLSLQHVRHSWNESSSNFLPTNSTYAKQYLGCIFFRQLGDERNSYHCWHRVPRAEACSLGNALAASLALGAACKVQQSIPGTGKVGACAEPLSPQPATEWGGTAVGIDPRLRNRRPLYYIIIDGAGKCHRRSAARYLLCCIVSLVCVGPLCFASSVPIACLFIPCAFSFHISPANPSWKNQL